jgi:hypothetical protein
LCEPPPPRSDMPYPLSVNPLANLEVGRGIDEPAHVGGGTRDVAAAAALPLPIAPTPHLDAVGQQLSVAVGLELLEVQPLDHRLHISHPLSTESLLREGLHAGRGRRIPQMSDSCRCLGIACGCEVRRIPLPRTWVNKGPGCCPSATLCAAMEQVPDAHHAAAARAFMARLTSTARLTSESKACIIISTFAFPLRTAVSVGLKAVLVLNARNR